MQEKGYNFYIKKEKEDIMRFIVGRSGTRKNK